MPLLTLWWLLFLAALGLCIGSFLNVVVYRIPRGYSLRRPLWSACPNCRERIRWYDNIPLLSFFALRGRCRHCKAPISPRYVVIEALMGITALMLLDAFFIGALREGLSESPVGVTERLAVDWPMYLAHLVLFACFLSMSAIDIEHYWVDVRFTNLATAVGFACHMLWTPRHSDAWPRPSDTTALLSLFGLAGVALTWLLMSCQPETDPEDFGEPVETQTDDDVRPSWGPATANAASQARSSSAAGIIAAATLIGLLAALTSQSVIGRDVAELPRFLVPLGLMFLLIVREASVSRPGDAQIVEAIHEERHTARSVALGELLLLLPVVAAVLLGWWLVAGDPTTAARAGEALHLRTPVYAVPMLRSWSPLFGLATAASGYLIAGALGWVVRIVFTLAFGKEAFGTGDIHLMAACGAVAGWPVAVIGFFLTCLLAMVGWAMTLPFKRARAIPLGPWLALSYLAVVVFYDQLVKWAPLQRVFEAANVLALHISQG